uniref:Uncharacterized protein n=1 Tax=Siphoviridae sp. ctDwe1 TaxID=2826200 RepID=A0A8S5M5E9_9CAUD|nr:MAG TPA: hypothetical protein [Siphoviridae sp. ctDwe1]DAQ69939.1 MAG TPA: hypothetical protein [Caudoviricetes sp.]
MRFAVKLIRSENQLYLLSFWYDSNSHQSECYSEIRVLWEKDQESNIHHRHSNQNLVLIQPMIAA